MEGKYVITKSQGPILFSGAIEHNAFESFGVIGAAQFKEINGEIKVFGRSISMNMEAKESDAVVIRTFMNARK